MFKSATVKLTLIYIAILLAICAFFSFNWYRVATHELNQALHRQSAMVEMLPNVRGSGAVRQLFDEREVRIVEGKRNIARQLLAVNVLLVLFGGLGSYFMAKRTLEPIEVAHQAQARFTADASHELRTPLAAMQTEIEVALRDPKLSKTEAVAMLYSNLEEVIKLRGLSDGLLRLARQDASGSVELQAVDLGAVLAKVADRTAKPAAAKNILVEFPKTAVRVQGQVDGLVEILVNLVDNAIKYSPSGSTVTVAAAADKQQAKVRVSDTGVGIKPADLPHIFERFYRADSSRTQNEAHGHGLGLSIAQHIAHAQGGSISVVSKPGKGSAFTLAMPLASADPSKTAPAPANS